MEGEALMAVEPGAHLGMLVGGVVVEDDVDGLTGRQFGVDSVEKADELLMPVTLLFLPMTMPSSTLRAANSVVVPLRL